MVEEHKVGRMIITDVRSLVWLRRYLNEEERKISSPAKAMWKRQSEIVSIDTVRLALEANTVPPEWENPWTRMIKEFVRDDITAEWVKSIAVAGDSIAKKVNRIQRKEFGFDSTMTSVKTWVDNEGGKLIVNLTAAQMGSIHALLQDQIALGVTSPYILAQRIKPIVGLTMKESLRLSKLMSALQEQGVTAGAITKRVERYAASLHKSRAARIARTELSNAYNFGQLDSMKQAAAEGWLPGVPEKSWMAGGSNPCGICEENEGVGPIALSDAFPSGHEHPTAHPQCECAVSYMVRR